MNRGFCAVLVFLFGILLGTLVTLFYATHPEAPTLNANLLDNSFFTRKGNVISELRKVFERLNGSLLLEPVHATTNVERINPTVAAEDPGKAIDLYNRTRVLCWIMTYSANLKSKAKAVRDTWAKRCNKAIFFSDRTNRSFPTVGIETEEDRSHLTAKTMKAFDYVYRHHFQDADWFLKADDDTYVIVENLRYLLSQHSPSEAVYFGHPFKVIVRQGYFSGGAGYVLSKAALQRLARRRPDLCMEDGPDEDVDIGDCMERLEVSLGESRDERGRSRFHCFPLDTVLSRKYMPWYYAYSKYNPDETEISDYPISFHYIEPEGMHFLEYCVYHLKAYSTANKQGT